MSTMPTRRAPAVTLTTTVAFLLLVSGDGASAVRAADVSGLVRSARSGPWSAPATWEGGKVPAAGARVQVRDGHTITYDLKSDRVIRSLHVAGTLRSAQDTPPRSSQ